METVPPSKPWKDSLDLLIKVGARVDAIWSFSVTLTTVAIGWVFLMSKDAQAPPPFGTRVAVMGVYLVALAMNVVALLKEYRMFLALVAEVVADVKALGESSKPSPMQSELAGLSYPKRGLLAYLVHLLYAGAVAWFVFGSSLLGPWSTSGTLTPTRTTELARCGPSATVCSRLDYLPAVG